MELTPEGPEEVRLAWEAAARAALEQPAAAARPVRSEIPEQYAILLTCRDEAQQVELLRRFQSEGLDWRTLLAQESQRYLKSVQWS